MRFKRDGFSVESAIAKGRPVPDWYENEPGLLPGDDFYLAEFWELDTTRQRGGGVLSPIATTEIERRAERRHGFEGDVLLLYERVLRALDDAFLTWQAEEYRRESGSGGAAAERKHGRSRRR